MHDGTATVSKSEYLDWLACPGYAWAVKHRPELAPPEDAATRRKQVAGDAVEALARTLFSDAQLIDTDDPIAAAKHTQQAITDGASTIFHGTVITDRGLLAEADVLVRDNDGWHLIEIKSSAADPARPNGLIKKYLPDISFQTLVLSEAGIPISRSSLLHVHRHYRRNGRVDPDKALAMTDVTDLVRGNLDDTRPRIAAALACLRDGGQPATCECHRSTRAHRCPLFEHFHPHIPASNTIYTISGIHRATLLPAVDRGIVDIVDWPDDLPLSARQRRQVRLARSREEIIQRGPIRDFLTQLHFPLHFLDYETFQQPIPQWEGFAPHQQVPFQYSLHILKADGTTYHREHICTQRGKNPVPPLVESLRNDVAPTGSVLVWNKAFEESRNREMAALLPDHASFLESLNARLVDLADVVSKGWWVHPDFEGRWSLKSVLPVAAPDLCYEDLEISDGSTAAELWMQCTVDPEDMLTTPERATIIRALREYCSLDTLAMVRIREHLQYLIEA